MTTLTKEWVIGRFPHYAPVVTVRPIRPSDAVLIEQMHRRLSPTSLYQRYLQNRIPPLNELAAVCSIRPERGAGFVATVQQQGEIVVGLAYYVREAYGQVETAEPGILVEDRFQWQGIGRNLWQQLHYHAQANQINQLRVWCAPGNNGVQSLLRGSGFAYQAKASYGLSEYLVAL